VKFVQKWFWEVRRGKTKNTKKKRKWKSDIRFVVILSSPSSSCYSFSHFALHLRTCLPWRTVWHKIICNVWDRGEYYNLHWS
jgi:hypothetical protein